jgi:hypothetical protein
MFLKMQIVQMSLKSVKQTNVPNFEIQSDDRGL